MRVFHTDYWMLDGGGGSTWDWSLQVPREHPPLILAGGLTPENVAAGIAQLHPFAVDVASGVESEPGIKDHAKLHAFAEAVAAQEPTEVGLQAPVGIRKPEGPPPSGPAEETAAAETAS
jgi:phosphoribosylanthranilate isomerase